MVPGAIIAEESYGGRSEGGASIGKHFWIVRSIRSEVLSVNECDPDVFRRRTGSEGGDQGEAGGTTSNADDIVDFWCRCGGGCSRV